MIRLLKWVSTVHLPAVPHAERRLRERPDHPHLARERATLPRRKQLEEGGEEGGEKQGAFTTTH